MIVRFDRVVRLLTDAQTARAFSAGAIEVGRSGGPDWQFACGALTHDEGAPAATPSTLFDLASLTKVIATTSLALRHAVEGRVLLNAPVGWLLPGWTGPQRARVTVADLLEHASGLPAWRDSYRRCRNRREFEQEIGGVSLEYPPRGRSVYSDLGFILLGFILEDAGGAPLEAQFAPWLGSADLRFTPPPSDRERTAPTEDDRAWRGRLLRGEVHDQNCHALGGVAGHAGLFGTAPAVGAFARLVLRSCREPTTLATPARLARFLRPSCVPGSSRALGWDTMRPTSSCGTRLTRAAVGHTGFTGTSLWIDPALDLYVVLLTNRAHPVPPVGQDDALRALRPRVHDAVVEAMRR